VLKGRLIFITREGGKERKEGREGKEGRKEETQTNVFE